MKSTYIPTESECQRILAFVRDGASPTAAIRYVVGLDLNLEALPVLAVAITAALDQAAMSVHV